MNLEDIAKLPANYTVCECYDVSFGDIMEAIENGCNTLEKIIHETSAGYGCERCRSKLDDAEQDKEVHLDEILEYAKSIALV
jgi:NAD(P)H-nitrite reductase large subunit